MKFVTFSTALLATGITAMTLPNSTTFTIVENGMRIELVPVSLDLANKYMQKLNSYSSVLADPLNSGPDRYTCQNPARALDYEDSWGAINMMKSLCHNDDGEGAKLPPYSALSVTAGSARISVCSYGAEIRCDATDMFAGWSTLDKACSIPGVPSGQTPHPAGYVSYDGWDRVYQREDCQDATLCGMENWACHPV